MKKISVIVPIYNVAPYLSQCIESILAQTYQNIEIILINDGSTDDSPRICDEYAKKYDKIQVIHQKNAGVTVARNNGLRHSTGEYLGFVDGDDWIEPNMYEIMADILDEQGKAQFINVGFWKEYEKKSILSGIYKKGLFTIEDGSSCSPLFVTETGYQNRRDNFLWSKLFRREPFLRFQEKIPTSITFAEDSCLFYSYIPFISGYFVLGQGFYHYRQRESSATGELDESAILQRLSLYYYLETMYQSHENKEFFLEKLQKSYEKEMRRWMFRVAPFSDSFLKKGYPVPFELFGGERREMQSKMELWMETIRK